MISGLYLSAFHLIIEPGPLPIEQVEPTYEQRMRETRGQINVFPVSNPRVECVPLLFWNVGLHGSSWVFMSHREPSGPSIVDYHMSSWAIVIYPGHPS